MRVIKAVFLKQFISQLRQPMMLGQALFFIGFIFVVSFLIGTEEEVECDYCIPAYVCAEHLEEDTAAYIPDPSMAGLMAVIFAGLSLIASTSALVQEDKTTQNLRFMTMAGVRPHQYLLGTGSCLLLFAVFCLFLFAMAGGYFGMQTIWFMAIAFSGAIVAVMFGIAMGLSKNPTLIMPLHFVIGFAPMLSGFNDTLARYLRFFFNQQMNLAISDLDADLSSNFMIIGINGAVALGLFVWMHRKGQLRW